MASEQGILAPGLPGLILRARQSKGVSLDTPIVSTIVNTQERT
jgi:hypothetical protein